MPLAELARVLARLDEPLLIVLAGCNGAGKTTFHQRWLGALGLPFVNADEIARGLNLPIDDALSLRAARLAETLRVSLIERRASFVMETVFSDADGAKLALLRDAQSAGYAVVLIFVGLGCAELSAARVLTRVALGGHDVPDARLSARYPRTLDNLARALPGVTAALVLDNSAVAEPYRPVALWEHGHVRAEYPALPEWYLGVRARVSPP